MNHFNEKLLTKLQSSVWDDSLPRPTPPKFPEYDINEEPPMWDFHRMVYGKPYIKPKPYTKIGEQPATDDDPDWRGVVRNQVIPLPLPEAYKIGRYNSEKYYWFDTPDYADPHKKVWFGFKFFLGTGGFLWALDRLYRGAPKGEDRIPTMARAYFKFVAPWTLAGVVASITCVALANLRGKKDDVYNYMAAGFLFGSIIGRRDHLVWFRSAFLSTGAGFLAKYMNERNDAIIPVLNYRSKHFTLRPLTGEDGFSSGDFRSWLPNVMKADDVGRDVRKTY